MTKYKYPVVVTLLSNEDEGGFIAYGPTLLAA
jgi:hypothetical protein